jgi:hypothetical protein
MIGIRTGECSGIWVVDLDVPNRSDPKQAGNPNGVECWPILVRKMGACPPTHAHVTPSGGRHLVFKWQSDRPVGCPQTLKPFGADIRGNGGYIIAPPSRRPDGKEYEIEDSLDYFNIVAAPDWLYRIVNPPPKPRRTINPQMARNPRFASKRIEGLRNTLRSAQDGNRNGLLYWTARRLCEAADELNLPRDAVFELAVDDAMHTHAEHERPEIMRTISSAFSGHGR